MKQAFSILLLFLSSLCSVLHAKVIICVNQIGYNTGSSKDAIIVSEYGDIFNQKFEIINQSNHQSVFQGIIKKEGAFTEWGKKSYYSIDFSALKTAGKFYIKIIAADSLHSPVFEIGENLLAQKTLPALMHYFRNQRANTPQELRQDKNVLLYGSAKTVDLTGGWCDASGDVSKYFSHLSYANFFSPQQIPLVTWSLIDASERMPELLGKLKLTDSIRDEAAYGADYLLKSLSEEGYFYMIVFSYFNKDPKARRVVGLHANSVTTDEYQCAFREGGGMAIAALARISGWSMLGKNQRTNYLAGAKRAYEHLKINNLKYCDDGKENIIDNYCALMAVSELFKVTKDEYYLSEARGWMQKLEARLSPSGYFISDDTGRPFFHASDAGLPVIALNRYLKLEKDKQYKSRAQNIINANLNYQYRISTEVSNPFGYPRQTFRNSAGIQKSFFIPHENETGWWWQGENARLASLASAALVKEKDKSQHTFATQQLNWILGLNPYQMCFMYGMGENNVPYMASNYGHGSQKGGISNGITGRSESGLGDGIDFKIEDKGNEWRWTEQWLPHAAWFLQAITAMNAETDKR